MSAEAIRFALRRRLADAEPTNRSFDEAKRENTWQDAKFAGWSSPGGTTFIDDDLLGFMRADAAKDEAKKGSTKVRRAVLEVTRAVSLDPWPGDVTFNAASPGATPSAAKKGASNPVPYAAELHATAYQYGIAMTPEHLRQPARSAVALRSLSSLGPVAGNHGRFLFDFSPDSAIYRITDDPAPRILYCFERMGQAVGIADLVRKVEAGDVPASELVLGGAIVDALEESQRTILDGADLHAGVLAACEAAVKRLGA